MDTYRNCIVIGLFAALAGCATIGEGVEKVREFSAARAGDLIIGECALSDDQRLKNVVAINEYLKAKPVEHRATAQDCDGDQKPDF